MTSEGDLRDKRGDFGGRTMSEGDLNDNHDREQIGAGDTREQRNVRAVYVRDRCQR